MCDKKREDLIKRLDAYFVEHLIMSPQKTRDLFREVRVALEQKPEIDDMKKYVEEKAEWFMLRCRGVNSLLTYENIQKDIKTLITQIIKDARGREVALTRSDIDKFISLFTTLMGEELQIIIDRFIEYLESAGVKIK